MDIRTKYFRPSKLFTEVLPRLIAERGVSPRGVMHVGAHLGEEVACYRRMGFEKILLVEPNPHCCALMRAAGMDVIECAVSPVHGAVKFNVVADDVGSSLLEPLPGTGISRHRVVDVHEVVSMPLGAVLRPEINMLVIDTQGTALDVLRSGPLAQLDIIVAEVHLGTPLYRDESDASEVIKHMAAAEFELAEIFVNRAKHHTYEDLVFVKC